MVLGGSCPGGNCPGGSCPRGVIALWGSRPRGSCPQGSCPRGSCPRGSCPRTLIQSHEECHPSGRTTPGLSNLRSKAHIFPSQSHLTCIWLELQLDLVLLGILSVEHIEIPEDFFLLKTLCNLIVPAQTALVSKYVSVYPLSSMLISLHLGQSWSCLRLNC